jgi:hypothetical protein
MHKLAVFPLPTYTSFSVLQSNLHGEWCWLRSSTLGGTTINYSPTDCFETFPFPWDTEAEPASTSQLALIGEQYDTQRQQVMLARDEGLTKTYNRFHSHAEASADIAELRRLHVAMDHAVAAAYGWQDLDLGLGFHETKQGRRYTISDSARHSLLDRLLSLNHQRYASEVAAGLHDKQAPSNKKPAAKRSRTPEASEIQEPLF